MSQLKAIQKHREIAIFTSLGEDVLLLHNFNYHEKLGELFSLQVEMLSERNGIVFEELLGQNVTARINLPEHETRYINGFITHFSQGEPKRGFATYHATISPWLWLLTRTSDCHIFQNLTVPDIIQEIFAKHGFAVFELRLTADYREWEYCVQYRETDFNFISRLMEQEGIYYFFEHESDNHTLILADAPSAHEPIPLYEEIPYYPPDSTVVRDHEYIGSWGVNKQVQPGTIALNDFNFKKPRADISTIKQKDQGHQASLLELFDYPGEYTESVESEFYSTVRLEELHVQYETIHATSSARGLTAGGLFCLFKHHRADQNKEYLVTSVSHTVQQDLFSSSLEQVAPFIHTNHFEVITSETPYRTQSNTPKPSIQGVQTAIVVGPPGEEIYTDEFGRVKCQFHWDRYGEMNQDSSCWIRVSQMWAGKEWGHIALPRIGQEVIVDFIEGDPDRPIITGRTYNADNMPPYPLDAMKTRMSIKSSTYKGDGFNELRFEDMAGEEEVFIHAQKNQNNIVRDSETTQIGNNRSETVANNESVMVVNGDRHITVKTGDEVKTIEQGNLTEGIAQTRSTLANVVNVKAQAGLKGSAPGIISHTADDLIHLKVGSSEIIITKDLIEIKQGGSAIKLDANVIDQKAGNIHLNKDGGASNGSSESADAELTETPAEELPPEEASAMEEPWLKEGLVDTEEVTTDHTNAEEHVSDEQQQKLATLKAAKNMAVLADDSYSSTGDPSTLPKGAKRLSPEDVDKLGIDSALLEDPDSGFASSIYQLKDDSYVIAFRGTEAGAEGKKDWGANLKSALGTDMSQFVKADKLTGDLVKQVGKENIQVTGHSLGGGLANYSAMKHGVPSTSFNPKGTTWREWMEISDMKGKSNRLINNYQVDGEVLTGVQENISVAMRAPGNNHQLPAINPATNQEANMLKEIGQTINPFSSDSPPISHPVARHGMDYVNRGLDAEINILSQ